MDGIIGPAHYDELEAVMGIDRRDPEMVAALAEVEARYERAYERACSAGNCSEWVDRETGDVLSSAGPVGLPLR